MASFRRQRVFARALGLSICVASFRRRRFLAYVVCTSFGAISSAGGTGQVATQLVARPDEALHLATCLLPGGQLLIMESPSDRKDLLARSLSALKS